MRVLRDRKVAINQYFKQPISILQLIGKTILHLYIMQTYQFIALLSFWFPHKFNTHQDEKYVIELFHNRSYQTCQLLFLNSFPDVVIQYSVTNHHVSTFTQVLVECAVVENKLLFLSLARALFSGKRIERKSYRHITIVSGQIFLQHQDSRIHIETKIFTYKE